MQAAWIVGAVRTPIGRHGGALSSVRPDDLGAVVLASLLKRTGIEPGEVEDVYFGCANQAGEDNRNVARMSLLLAGYPETVAGATVNRLCGANLGLTDETLAGIFHENATRIYGLDHPTGPPDRTSSTGELVTKDGMGPASVGCDGDVPESEGKVPD